MQVALAFLAKQVGMVMDMSRSQRKEREAGELKRLAALEEEERRLYGPPENCVFCGRPDLHDMEESHRLKGKWEKKFEDHPVCLQCHNQLHRLHKNRELARKLNTIEAVLEDESFGRFLTWAKKLPPETIY